MEINRLNLDKYSDIGTNSIALYAKRNIPKEIKKFIEGSAITPNIYRLQAYDVVMYGDFYIGFIDFMRKGKSLTDFTNLFSPNNFKKDDDIITSYLKSGRTNMYPNLNDQQQYRLDKTNEVKNYFIAEIRERELMSKSGGISIASFATVFGALVGIASASFSFACSITTGIVKKSIKNNTK